MLWRDFWALMVVFGVAQVLYLGVVNPKVIGRRMGIGKGTEAWDWAWFAVFTPAFAAILLVAARDIRLGEGLLAGELRPVGLLLFVLGGGLFVRAMGENPFFEKTVRIQPEHGHRVVDTGPYRFVRHPGYVGFILLVLSFPLLLTSPRAIYPTVFAAAWIVVRTALEDRMLHQKLTGYADYATRVRARLLPGVW